MLFSEVLGSMTRSGDGWTARVPADWLQGRSAFGGLQAALALRAMRAVAPEHPLRVFQTTFIAPVTEGGARIETRLLRSGKTTVHAEARLFDGDDLAALAIGVFGKSRRSEVRLSLARPELPPGPPAIDLRDAPVAFPAFLEHFEMRWLRGAPPGSGNPSLHAVIEVGLRDPGVITEAHVLALADAPPPVALSILKTPVPGSSLTWTLEMLGEGGDAGLARLGPTGWRLDVELVAASDGYTSQAEMVWGPGGEAVALSRQCMVVFG